MFLTELPGSLEAASGASAGIGAMIGTATATAGAAHAAVVPMSMDPTALLLHAHHGLDAANFQAVQAAGLANHFGIVTTLATSGTTYDVTEAANMSSML
jgi:hypothetical protein